MNSQDTQPTSVTTTSWRKPFAMDFRSLALFRILIGLILLADVFYRLPTLVAMYTDDGVMTRDVVYRYYQKFIGTNWDYGVWSLHWISGDALWQYVLFGVAAVAAIALTLGWKTRIATIVSWILLASLHARNPLILTSGDTILKLTMFWSIFLPLGRIWSLDARKLPPAELSKAPSYFSFATVGFLMQIILMYFFTGVAKCNEDWFSGLAMEYVLRLDIYILPMGHSLLEATWFLTLVTYATLFVEVIGVWFLLSPRHNDLARWFNILAYWGFHIGIGLTMSIGLFPLICLIIWIPVIPTSFWKFVQKKAPAESDVGETTLVTLPPGGWSIALNGFLALILLFVTLLNISNIDHPVCQKFLPRAVVPIGFWLNLDQRFQMFGRPPKSNPWFVYEATLKDKSQVDVMRPTPEGQDGATVSHERPENVRLSLPGHHWRKLHRNLVNPVRDEFRQALVDYAVRDWNARHDDEKQIVHLRLTCYAEAIGPDYNGTHLDSTVWGSFKDPEHSSGSQFDKLSEELLDGMPF